MELSSEKVVKILKSKGIDKIYHANSVLTSCHFLRKGKIMSRGSIERDSLIQTMQYSDEDDKKLGIWHDLFFDSDDIHSRTTGKRPNDYGPVCFVFDVDILKTSKYIWVTKENPVYWLEKNLDRKGKWFQSSSEIESGLFKGRLNQHFVARNIGGQIDLNKFLLEIILDDPKKSTPSKVNYYSMAYGALVNAADIGGIKVEIKRRNCHENCVCVEKYRSKWTIFRKLFWPKLL